MDAAGAMMTPRRQPEKAADAGIEWHNYFYRNIEEQA
jgi:hypothetical protein